MPGADIMQKIMAKSGRVRATAEHFQVDYSIADLVADGFLPRNANAEASYWHAWAHEESRKRLGSNYEPFVRTLQTVIEKRGQPA